MTQEDKKLLLIDLCARLPYGVKVRDELGRTNKLVIGNADLIRLYYNDFSIYSEKELSFPLLRPMSSMTEEERTEYLNACGNEMDNAFSSPRYDGIDYLNAHHFDYRGLIPKNLAIKITKENNPYK